MQTVNIDGFSDGNGFNVVNGDVAALTLAVAKDAIIEGTLQVDQGRIVTDGKGKIRPLQTSHSETIPDGDADPFSLYRSEETGKLTYKKADGSTVAIG